MGFFDFLFGSPTEVKQSGKRVAYYHVFKSEDTYVAPVCSFRSKKKAWSFARRISRQNNISACVMKTYDKEYDTLDW